MQSFSKSDVQIIRGSDLFDSAWYLSQYLDVAALNLDPVEHYLWLGARLSRNPSPKFSTADYLSANADVQRNDINPLLHYLRFGKNENRPVYPVFSSGQKSGRAPVKRILKRRIDSWDDNQSAEIERRLSVAPYLAKQDLVSIIMPTRNRADRIGKAIVSALEQTHRAIELIIVDDDSTDNTDKIVGAIDDPRIRYLYNDGQNGVSQARNFGLAAAKGDWVFFLDSDNTWAPTMIEFMLKHAEMSAVSAGYCAADVRDDEGNRKSVLYADFDFESLIKENFIDMNCFFMRWDAEFAGFRFDESLKRLVDWDFILRIAARTRVKGLPILGVRYYDGSDQRISNGEYKKPNTLNQAIEVIRNRARQEVAGKSTIQDSAAKRIAVVCHVYHQDKVSECLAYLNEIGFDFDLYVTTSLDVHSEAISKLRNSFPEAYILHYPNRGADIAPFLELNSTLKNYSLVAKIHTKRDAGKWGATWRHELMQSVLRSRDYVDEVVELFKNNPKLKLVGSRALYKHGRKNSIPETLDQVERISKSLGFGHFLNQDWAFIAGTMFWVRPEFIQPLANHMYSSPGYSTTFRQDGALEHGLERVIGLSLFSDPEAQVGLADSDGQILLYPRGMGYSLEGVSDTLSRLTK